VVLCKSNKFKYTFFISVSPLYLSLLTTLMTATKKYNRLIHTLQREKDTLTSRFISTSGYSYFIRSSKGRVFIVAIIYYYYCVLREWDTLLARFRLVYFQGRWRIILYYTILYYSIYCCRLVVSVLLPTYFLVLRLYFYIWQIKITLVGRPWQRSNNRSSQCWRNESARCKYVYIYEVSVK